MRMCIQALYLGISAFTTSSLVTSASPTAPSSSVQVTRSQGTAPCSDAVVEQDRLFRYTCSSNSSSFVFVRERRALRGFAFEARFLGRGSEDPFRGNAPTRLFLLVASDSISGSATSSGDFLLVDVCLGSRHSAVETDLEEGGEERDEVEVEDSLDFGLDVPWLIGRACPCCWIADEEGWLDIEPGWACLGTRTVTILGATGVKTSPDFEGENHDSAEVKEVTTLG